VSGEENFVFHSLKKFIDEEKLRKLAETRLQKLLWRVEKLANGLRFAPAHFRGGAKPCAMYPNKI